MEKNEVLLLSEVIYQIHACDTMHDLERNFFHYLNLYIPFSYASYIEVREDPHSGKQQHSVRFCSPASFASAERSWLALLDKANTVWLSSGAESVVVRCSELFNGNRRLETPSYQQVFLKYNIFDDIQMNLVHNGRTVGRMSLYRTQADGGFSDQDTDNLRVLSKHINLAFHRCSAPRFAGNNIEHLSALAAQYGLTRREEEILEMLLQGMDNTNISDTLKISKNTLYKHNNSIFQKCGVGSRWELLKLLQ